MRIRRENKSQQSLSPPQKQKKVINDQPTHLFGSILENHLPKCQNRAMRGLVKNCIFVLFWLVFTQHNMFFFLHFLGRCGVGDKHGSILSFCILGVFAFWSLFGPFLVSVAIWASLNY